MEKLTPEQKQDLKGKRIKLVKMDDPHTKLKTGDMGTCRGVDSLDQLLMDWDDGSRLSLIPNEDKWEVVTESRILNFKRFK